MKTFEVTFNSKKTVHPDGEVTRKFLVRETTKTKASARGKLALKGEDPENFDYYKSAKIKTVEDGIEQTSDLEPAPVPEPASKKETKLKEGKAAKYLDPSQPHFDNGNYDMPNSVYHAANGISSSMLKKSCESMMLYKGLYVTKEIEQPKGDALRFGNLFHTLVLEPAKFEEEYIVLDDSIDRRTKEGREAYAIVTEKAEKQGLIVVTNKEYDHAFKMAGTALNDKYANRILRSPTRRTEVSFFDTHRATGLTVKVRPDLIVGDVCVDLKSVHINRSVDGEWMLEHLRREVLKYKYHLSAAMYLEVARLKEFVWIFVNKAPGYHWVATIRAGEAMLLEGEELYHTAMHRIDNAQKTNEWLGPLSILPSVQGSKIILPEI